MKNKTKRIEWKYWPKTFLYTLGILLPILAFINRICPDNTILGKISFSNADILFLGPLIIVLVKYAETLIPEIIKQPKNEFDFHTAMSQIILKNRKYKSVKIYCATMHFFRSPLEILQPYIAHLRIIVRDPNLPKTDIHDEVVSKRLSHDTIGNIQTIRDFGNNHFDSLEVRKVMHDPHVFFILVDGEKGFYGIFTPTPPDDHGSRLHEISPCIMLDCGDRDDKDIFRTLDRFFDNVFNSFSKPFDE